MITKAFYSILVASCLSLASWGQTSKSKIVPVEGTYSYLAIDSLSGIQLELKPNGSFHYTSGGCLQTMHSYGTWKIKGDTVLITSTFDAENIPITIIEKRVDSLKDHLTFDLVKNLDGKMMGALLQFNRDTTSVFDPLMRDDRVKKVGSINSLRVEFGNKAYSRWHTLKNKKANLIAITVDAHDFLTLYLYFKNEKYLYKNGGLYPLPITEVTEYDLQNGGTVKREIFLQKKTH